MLKLHRLISSFYGKLMLGIVKLLKNPDQLDFTALRYNIYRKDKSIKAAESSADEYIFKAVFMVYQSSVSPDPEVRIYAVMCLMAVLFRNFNAEFQRCTNELNSQHTLIASVLV